MGFFTRQSIVGLFRRAAKAIVIPAMTLFSGAASADTVLDFIRDLEKPKAAQNVAAPPAPPSAAETPKSAGDEKKDCHNDGYFDSDNSVFNLQNVNAKCKPEAVAAVAVAAVAVSVPDNHKSEKPASSPSKPAIADASKNKSIPKEPSVKIEKVQTPSPEPQTKANCDVQQPFNYSNSDESVSYLQGFMGKQDVATCDKPTQNLNETPQPNPQETSGQASADPKTMAASFIEKAFSFIGLRENNPKLANTLSGIFMFESELKFNAVSPTGAFGVGQQMPLYIKVGMDIHGDAIRKIVLDKYGEKAVAEFDVLRSDFANTKGHRRILALSNRLYNRDDMDSWQHLCQIYLIMKHVEAAGYESHALTAQVLGPGSLSILRNNPNMRVADMPGIDHSVFANNKINTTQTGAQVLGLFERRLSAALNNYSRYASSASSDLKQPLAKAQVLAQVEANGEPVSKSSSGTRREILGMNFPAIEKVVDKTLKILAKNDIHADFGLLTKIAELTGIMLPLDLAKIAKAPDEATLADTVSNKALLAAIENGHEAGKTVGAIREEAGKLVTAQAPSARPEFLLAQVTPSHKLASYSY